MGQRSDSSSSVAPRSEFLELVTKAEKGDADALNRLKPVLQDPHFADVFGNVAADVEKQVIEFTAGKSPVRKAGIQEKLRHLRAELAGPSPSPVEKLLVDRVALCWLQLHQVEAAYYAKPSLPIELADHYQRSCDRAQRRFLTAIKALAEVRRLALPVLLAQVNIAGKQLNVAGQPPAEIASGSPTP